MTELTDAALVEQCRAGDKSAYGRLVTRHQLRVQRVLQAMLPYYEVDDVVQEAFLEAYLNLGKLRQPERFRAWLCGIGINLAVRQNAPIFVTDEVMEAAGTLPDEDGIYRFECSPSRPGISWHSLLREEASKVEK